MTMEGWSTSENLDKKKSGGVGFALGELGEGKERKERQHFQRKMGFPIQSLPKNLLLFVIILLVVTLLHGPSLTFEIWFFYCISFDNWAYVIAVLCFCKVDFSIFRLIF